MSPKWEGFEAGAIVASAVTTNGLRILSCGAFGKLMSLHIGKQAYRCCLPRIRCKIVGIDKGEDIFVIQ